MGAGPILIIYLAEYNTTYAHTKNSGYIWLFAASF